MSTPSSGAWTLGLDFGTSTTSAAHTSSPGHAIASIRLSHDASTMHSSVFVESPDHVDVGDAAIDRSRANPMGFLSAPKRTIAQGTAHINGYDLPASVPIAAIFRSVIDRAATEHDNIPPESLVITHPESWSAREIQVLLDAAAAVGFDSTRVRTVSESRAAAHFYTRAKGLRPGSKIAVFDYGGGTLDVAVLSMNDDSSFQLLAADGDVHNGGRYLDSLIRDWVDEQLSTSHPEVLSFLRSSARVEQHYALADSITRAKELLSESRTARILVPTADGHLSLDLSRGVLEDIIDAPLRQAHDVTASVLHRAGITSAYDLEALYLTGGSSRIPLVAERLAPLGPIATLDDPKAVVALGALTASQHVARAQHITGHAAASGAALRTGTDHPPQSASQTGVAGGARTSHRNTWIAALSVAVLLSLALAGAAWLMMSGSEGNDSQNQSSEPASAVNRDGPATTKDEVLNALPPQFVGDLTDCEVSGETEYGGIEMRCDFAEDAASLAGMDERFGVYFTVSADPDNTSSEIAALRKGLREDRFAVSNELVENDDRTAAAMISEGENSTDLRYSNTDSHVTFRIFSMESPEIARQFLERSGFLTD